MSIDPSREKDEIERAFALSRVERPAYSQFYDFLESLFILRAEAKGALRLEVPRIDPSLARTKWENGFPLLGRWDFPLDVGSAEDLLQKMVRSIPEDNRQLRDAHAVLSRSLSAHRQQAAEFWESFLHHEMDPWREYLAADSGPLEPASVLFLARSALRPSVEFTAEKMLETLAIPDSWLKGYCPVCGSLPSILYVEGEGARRGFCSWCGTRWNLYRLQCPHCENRYHESLGYLSIEAEPQNRVVYCNLCKVYFKQIDVRELAYAPYLPLEEWTTIHLDLVAQKAGWQPPPSPSPKVYGTGKEDA